MTELTGLPLDRQSPGVQLFTIAVRRWVKGAVAGQCVCHVIGAAFRTVGLQTASAPFHAAMQTLCQNARGPLRFGTAERLRFSEHEAKLVEALIAAGEERFDDLRISRTNWYSRTSHPHWPSPWHPLPRGSATRCR